MIDNSHCLKKICFIFMDFLEMISYMIYETKYYQAKLTIRYHWIIEFDSGFT